MSQEQVSVANNSREIAAERANRFSIPVAERVQSLPPYLFGQINDLKYRQRSAGIDVIDLGMGNPTDPPDGMIIEAMRAAVANPRNHRYATAAGIPQLRQEVAAKYRRRYGVDVDPSTEVLATLGSKEAFSHMCLALLGPGDICIAPAPAFPIHVHAPLLAAAHVLQLEIADPARFLAETARLCETLCPPPKVVIVNFPHNPTTVTVETDFYTDLVALAKKHSFMVLSDFAYSDIGFDGYEPPSFLSTPGACGVGVEFTTMSKGYNMAGWRVGYCVGNAQMVKALATVKAYYDYGIFQAIQVACIIALRDGETARLAQSAEYQRRRDILVKGLRQGGWEVELPRAGMFVWARIPEPFRSQMDSVRFAMKLLEEAHVATSPGGGFGLHGEAYLRLALVENGQRLQQALRQINRVLRPEMGTSTSQTRTQPKTPPVDRADRESRAELLAQRGKPSQHAAREIGRA